MKRKHNCNLRLRKGLLVVLLGLCLFVVPFHEMLIILLGIGYISLLFHFLIKGLYKQAREMREESRREFRAVTGHDPPKTSMDNWWRWDSQRGGPNDP